MLLKEIDLDLPFIEEGTHIKEIMEQHKLKKDEAIRFYYEENWKEKRIKFRDEVRCVAELYLYHLGKYKTIETKKLMINCVEKIVGPQILNVDGFTDVQVVFEIENYFSLSNYEKKRLILEKIREGVSLVVKKFNWDYSIFEQAYNKVIEEDYQNQYIWKQKVSPKRKYIGEVFCQHDIEEFSIYMVIKDYNDKKEIKRVFLQSDRPNEFAFVKHLGKLEWLSQDEIVLINKSGKNQWVVKI
ncbi:hypothetical protein CN326_23440 [Bacillus sp. AFS018417]|uniref:hypothetical protein n=1 Tax=Bacillus sp. AFS018417 TaxID=2033491 RepID=UPI000BF4BD58|nr:hypothetical protein [Bacillus sp. AFS018417]PEY99127.1 hypothetical protein CN326_23440 [Bacillus sp. AFS018417]